MSSFLQRLAAHRESLSVGKVQTAWPFPKVKTADPFVKQTAADLAPVVAVPAGMPGITAQPSVSSPMVPVPLPLAGGALDAADMAFLKDRALRYQQILGEILGTPFGSILQISDGRARVAAMTALARFGDDVNYATNQPSVGFNQAKREAALVMVETNVLEWFKETFGYVPSPPAKPPAMQPVPGPPSP